MNRIFIYIGLILFALGITVLFSPFSNAPRPDKVRNRLILNMFSIHNVVENYKMTNHDDHPPNAKSLYNEAKKHPDWKKMVNPFTGKSLIIKDLTKPPSEHDRQFFPNINKGEIAYFMGKRGEETYYVIYSAGKDGKMLLKYDGKPLYFSNQY